MNKLTIVSLQCRCIAHENNAITPQRRRYWDIQFRRLTFLARRLGWID